MKVLIAGASGLIGTALQQALRDEGHTPIALIRVPSEHETLAVADTRIWSPKASLWTAADFEGFDAVVNLAGENIASRWTAKKKQQIRHSRVMTTERLCTLLQQLKTPPKKWVNASAVGYYGNRRETVLDETASAGEGFLASVCQEWEAATAASPIPVNTLRTGVVLTPKGGALKKMLTPFRLGLGGVVGSGAQYMSWISLEDIVRVILFLLEHPNLTGPINATAPHPVTNRQFTKALGKAVGRPTLFPFPAPIARLLLGQMADELLLSSTRARPAKLESAGFTFHHTQVEEALKGL